MPLALVITLIVLFVVLKPFYTVEEAHAVIIERLGRFQTITGPGFHLLIPVLDRRAATIPLRTQKNDFDIDVKTSDNVTVGLRVSAQYHVDGSSSNAFEDSGVYRAYYTLQAPDEQMRDYLTDALRSAVPSYTLDELFAKKDDIARDAQATVADRMSEYGFVISATLITNIALPSEVEASMNRINAAQRERAAAQDLAEADRIKRVTEAKAEAEAMEATGRGVANQRKAIAAGIADSLAQIQETGVTSSEANQLFMFTQWTEMMADFAKTGSSTVVLPGDFRESASMFEQMVAAEKTSGK